MLTLENTEEYSKSTDRYLKFFLPGLGKALSYPVCQFVAKVTAVCAGGSVNQPGVGFCSSLSCAGCTVAFGAKKAACP